MIRLPNDPTLHRYDCRFDVDNFDYLCRIALRQDKSISVVLNEIVSQIRLACDVTIRQNGKAHVDNGLCQMTPQQQSPL